MTNRFKVTDGNTALGTYPTANAAARYMREATIRRPRHGGDDYLTLTAAGFYVEQFTEDNGWRRMDEQQVYSPRKGGREAMETTTHAELQIAGGLRGPDGGTWPRPCPCGKSDCWIYGPPMKCDGCGRHSFRVSLTATTTAGNVFVCSRACIPAAVRNAQAGR